MILSRPNKASRSNRLIPSSTRTQTQYYHFKPQNLLDYSPGVESPTAFVLPSTSTSSSGDEIEAAAALDALRLLAGKAVLVSGLPESEAAAPAPPATGKGKGVGWMWVPPPLGTKGWTEKHVTSLRLAHEVLRASVDRPPIFYCYGGACCCCVCACVDWLGCFG